LRWKFKEFKTNSNGFNQAIKWAGNAHWAIEGAYCFGRAFTAHLIKNGCEVYEINPLLTKSWRGALKVASPKNDYGDAKVISLFAHTSNLEKISLETVKLKEKLSTRKALVKQKTKITNFIKMLYFTRGEKLPFKKLNTQKAVNYLINSEDIIIKTNGKILKEVIEGIKVIEKEIEKETPERAKKLMQLKGISFITASTIYTETKGKITTSAKLASYCGVSPIDCSSGKNDKNEK
jgi:transposase